MFLIPCSMNPDEFLPIFLFINSFFISALFVTKWAWEPLCKRFNNETMPPLPYPVEYPLDENDPECENLDEMIDNVIVERTPDGTVFMRYNHELEGFEYWSENSIPFKFLDTAARKYVLTFRCKNAYTEHKTTVVKDKEHDPSFNNVDSDLFVKPKKSAKKKTIVSHSNNFIFKGTCKEAPFFKEEVVKKTFFCGGKIEGLDYNSFKNAIFKKKYT